MHKEYTEVVVLPLIREEQWRVAVGSTLQSVASGMTVILGSSLALRRSRRHPAASVDGVAVAVESTVLRVRPGSNAEGSADGDLALVKVRTPPMLALVCHDCRM